MHSNFRWGASLIALSLLITGCDTANLGDSRRDALVVGQGGTTLFTATGELSLLANDELGESAVVATTPVVAPAHGTLQLFADGRFEYVHDGSAQLQDSFTYAVTEGDLTLEVVVTITVQPADRPPVAAADSFSGALGNTTYSTVPGASGWVVSGSGSLLSNDSDPDGEVRAVPETVATDEGGVATIHVDGSFEYLPAAGFLGADSFEYRMTDLHDTAAASVAVQVGEGLVWIDGDAGAGGDGRSASPFASIEEFNNASLTREDLTVYVDAADSAYVGTITMGVRMVLHGSGTALSIGGLSVPAGERPLLESDSDRVIVYAADTTIRGLDVGDAGAVSIGMQQDVDEPPATLPTLTIRDVAVGGTGTAFESVGYDLDVEFDSLASVNTGDGPQFGLSIDSGSGRFVVKGETVISGTAMMGIALGPVGGMMRDPAPPEFLVEVEFQGKTTLTNCGVSTLAGPEGQCSVVLVYIKGAVTFADVDVHSRHNLGIGLYFTAGDVTFGDVDVFNEEEAPGPGFISAMNYATVSLASLDITDALRWQNGTGVMGSDMPGALILSQSVSYGDFGVDLGGLSLLDAVFEIRADGVQGNGGVLSGSDSSGLYMYHWMDANFRGMEFTGHPAGAVVLGCVDEITFDGCEFSDWGFESDGEGMPTGALIVAFDESGGFTVGERSMQVEVTDCDFDGQSPQCGTAPPVTVAGLNGAAVAGSVFFGRPDEGEVSRGNRLFNLATGALEIETDEVGVTCEIVNNHFDRVGPGGLAQDSVIYWRQVGLGRNSLWVSGNTATGGFGDFAYLYGEDAVDVGGSGVLFGATIEDNVVSGANGFATVREWGEGVWNVQCTGNTCTGLRDHAVVASFNAVQAPDEMSMLRMEGNSYGFVADFEGRPLDVPAFGSPYLVEVQEAACMEFRDEVFSGVNALSDGLPVMEVGCRSDLSGQFEVTLDGNQTDVGASGALLWLRNPSAGTLVARVAGHTAGVVELHNTGAGLLQVEDLANFGTLNSGAEVTNIGGTSSSVNAGTVALPPGPWR